MLDFCNFNNILITNEWPFFCGQTRDTQPKSLGCYDFHKKCTGKKGNMQHVFKFFKQLLYALYNQTRDMFKFEFEAHETNCVFLHLAYVYDKAVPLDSKWRFTEPINISDETLCRLVATGTFCQSAQCHIKADSILHSYCNEDLKISHQFFSAIQTILHLYNFSEVRISLEVHFTLCLIKHYTMKMYGVYRQSSMHS
jgi:hypothetical protein